MKRFSRLSLGFLIAGLVFLLWKTQMEGSAEPVLLTALLCLVIGAIFSLLAMAKKEKGKTKFTAIASFFAVTFMITWFEPFEIIRLMTWLKHFS